MSRVLVSALLTCACFSAQGDYLDEVGEAPQERCGYCHEIDGNPRMTRYPRLAGQHSEYIVKQLRDFRGAHREGEMQGTAEMLSDEEIDNVAEYFTGQSVQLPDLDPQPVSDQQAAARLFVQGDTSRGLPACASCHGVEGQGNGLIPRLAGQHARYLREQFSQFADGRRQNDINGQMRAVAALLDETEMAMLADYLARVTIPSNLVAEEKPIELQGVIGH